MNDKDSQANDTAHTEWNFNATGCKISLHKCFHDSLDCQISKTFRFSNSM